MKNKYPRKLLFAWVFLCLLNNIGYGQNNKIVSTKIQGENANGKQIIDAKGNKVTILDFADAYIEGKAKTPDGFRLQARSTTSQQSAIELKRNFRQQINTSSQAALIVVNSSN